jgi:hypothetical protein
VVNGLTLTCEFPIWHSWEGPETTSGAYGNSCKPAHTVHVVNNFNFNNIFINDLFDGIEGLGCEVPGCVDTLDSRQPLRVPGQLFAGDTVGLAPSLDNLHAMFAHFSQWAEDHYMGLCVNKCGVIALEGATPM